VYTTNAMVPTCLDRTFAHASHISSLLLKSAYVARSEVVLVLSYISERRAGLWVKLPSTSVNPYSRSAILILFYFRRYLVYNLRKRGGDSADKYFKSTEMIAGVKDMRFQALMPDVLHWLGIRKIDNMISMSDM